VASSTILSVYAVGAATLVSDNVRLAMDLCSGGELCLVPCSSPAQQVGWCVVKVKDGEPTSTAKRSGQQCVLGGGVT